MRIIFCNVNVYEYISAIHINTERPLTTIYAQFKANIIKFKEHLK